jgi:hypothetical protein
MIVEGIGYSLDCGTNLAFAWKHERKPCTSSVSTLGVSVEFCMSASRMEGSSSTLDLAWSVNMLPALLHHNSQVQIFSLALCSSQNFAPLTDTVHQWFYYFFLLRCKIDRFTVLLLFTLAQSFHSVSLKNSTVSALNSVVPMELYVSRQHYATAVKKSVRSPSLLALFLWLILRRFL